MSNSGSTLIDAVNAAYPAMAQLYASDWYVAEARNEGWYVGQGCAISASGTAGKVDMTAGTILIGTADKAVAAVTAASTTITSLEHATLDKWVACEIDTSGVLQFNAGTAAANPEKPSPTTNRVVVAWLYVLSSAVNTAHAVDALTSSANGKAKIIDARQLVPGPSVTGWSHDQNTWTYVSATTGVGGGVGTYKVSGLDVTGYLPPGTKVSWNDGSVQYGVIGASSFSTDTTITLVATSDYTLSGSAIIRPRYSYAHTPQGWPSFFNWSPTAAGYSTTPATAGATYYAWHLVGARTIKLELREASNGTSNNTATTYTLPIASNTTTNGWATSTQSFVDNSAIGTAFGLAVVTSSNTVLSVYTNAVTTGAWTASGGKRVIFGSVEYRF